MMDNEIQPVQPDRQHITLRMTGLGAGLSAALDIFLQEQALIGNLLAYSIDLSSEYEEAAPSHSRPEKAYYRISEADDDEPDPGVE